MAVNNGFLIRSDRTLITDTHKYVITGYIVPDTKLIVTMGGKEVPAEINILEDNYNEHFGGLDTTVTVTLPDAEELGKLKLETEGPLGKRLAYEISAKELREKMRVLRVFVDECAPVAGEDCLRVNGWAASLEHVDIAVLDADKQRIECGIERYKRPDIEALYTEYPMDGDCGFAIEIRPVPKKKIYLLMRAGKERYARSFPTSGSGIARGKAADTVRKGMTYLKYNGIGAVIRKSGEKLMNLWNTSNDYPRWLRKHLPDANQLKLQRGKKFDYEPLISIVVPLYRSPEKYLREFVDSVCCQTYSNWELVMSDGSGSAKDAEGSGFDRAAFDRLLDELEGMDERIRVIRNDAQLRIAANTNAALDAAKGDYIAFCDHDDLLTANALFENVTAINRKPETELLYSDEDKVNEAHQFFQPNMKPDFAPDFLDSGNYICHLLVVKRSLLEKVGGLDPEFDGAQDFDFVLRCTEQTKNIVHIPKILYHWRSFEGSTAGNPKSKQYAFEAGERAVNAHYKRLGLPATAKAGLPHGIYHTTWHWPTKPSLTVLIPNKDHIDDLDKCVQSIFKKEKYPNYEILIVENNSTEKKTFEYYEKLKSEHDNVRVVTYEGSFNYSKINNFGASHSDAEYLLLLNNDTELIADDVFEQMLGFAMRKDVGAVGARLYYHDNTIQHAGVILGWGGVAGHAFVLQNRNLPGYQCRIITQQNYSAVTAACMMVRRDVFDEVGGFTEELAVAFNDIDLCLKIRKAGYLIVYNPLAELYHYESKSRGLDTGDPEKVRRFQSEIVCFQKKWGDVLEAGDPYYNPNLSMETQDFSLRNL